MSKVKSFREVKLSTNVNQLKNVSKFWVVQFVGSPGIKFWTSMSDMEVKTNVHYICTYVYNEEYKTWMVNPYKCKLLVESFDFETGIVKVNWHGEIVDFHVVDFEEI